MNKLPLQADSIVGYTSEQLKSPFKIKPTKKWFENLPKDALKYNNYATIAFCNCLEYSLINLNYFVRIVAKLYSLKDLDPPEETPTNKKSCVNEDFNPKKTLITFDQKDVIDTISHFCEMIGERDLMILNCVKCSKRNMSAGLNNVANELINCLCIRQPYCYPDSIVSTTKFCKKPNIDVVLGKDNRYLFSMYLEAVQSNQYSKEYKEDLKKDEELKNELIEDLDYAKELEAEDRKFEACLEN